MIARDKNHPCVVMWSIANEPELDGDGERPQQAYDYFRPLYELAHASDPQNKAGHTGMLPKRLHDRHHRTNHGCGVHQPLLRLVQPERSNSPSSRRNHPTREAFSGVIPPILGGFTPLRP